TQSQRPPRSIQQRWAKLHQSMTQFKECYKEEQARLDQQSTPSATEKVVVEALKQYKIKTNFNFSHHLCWTILRNRREWLDHLNKTRLTTTSSGPKSQPEDDNHPLESSSSKSVNLSTDNNEDLKRLELIQELIDSINEKNELSKQFVELANQTNQIKIMEKFLPDDHHSLVWFEIQHQEILNEFNLHILSYLSLSLSLYILFDLQKEIFGV
ncbi:hypothetical protein PSTG_17440, partial [Puccinia striiformis f. sp. tritici PST-78]